MRITDTHVYFWRGPFSNWHRQHNLITDPVNNELMFTTTEQAFMWWKAVFFQDMRMAGLITKENDPQVCKKYGREIANFEPKLWACVSIGYMNYVNYLKYSQNEDLKKILLDTGNKVLVEASPYDKIWGVGLAEEDDKILDEKNWVGTNLLGKSLMTVRDMLK